MFASEKGRAMNAHKISQIVGLSGGLRGIGLPFSRLSLSTARQNLLVELTLRLRMTECDHRMNPPSDCIGDTMLHRLD
jgi:hypothetical protein